LILSRPQRARGKTCLQLLPLVTPKNGTQIAPTVPHKGFKVVLFMRLEATLEFLLFAQHSRMSHNLHVRGLSLSFFAALYCAVMRT